MTEQNLIERLNFKEDDVFLDGKVIFSVPHRPAKSGINLLGVPENGRTVYVGSGQCCYGPITILKSHSQESEEPNFQLDAMRMPDFNVYDIIPASVDHKKTGFANEGAILTTGYGCAGSGVRLIDTYNPKTIEVVSGEEFQEMWNSRVQNWVMPRLNVNEQEGRITLDLLRSGYRLKAGKSRDPNLPSILLDSNAQEWYVSQDVWASKDLTPVLNEIGVDVEKTIEANRGYTRIRH
ncbi:MAG: hypothetical protein ABH824_04110 [Nanoarchaeota archaeon]|nr:hypothetical protein [Nanoarchaeota archaeon]MBU1631989.1 hypothetical protein [Nanoarchaeota archaeon]MBU1876099.1 hypothetical protein [Nanoarchaeota archaeon]